LNGGIYQLALATDLTIPAQILSRVWLLMLVSVPLVLLLAGGTGYWMSGRAIAPVSDIIAAARSMDSSRLNERIEVPATGDEIQQLAETINGMLIRIEEGFQKVRQFTADASHELRTPLAIIRANAEVALLDTGANSAQTCRDTLERILKESERDSALLENLLQLARAGLPSAIKLRKSVDLRTSLALACTDIRTVAAVQGLTVRVTCEDCPCLCEGDEEQLRRL